MYVCSMYVCMYVPGKYLCMHVCLYVLCMCLIPFYLTFFFFYFFILRRMGNAKLKFTTLPPIFMRVVCRFNSVAFATQR